MDIKKADSKGRVSGFEPGSYYAFDPEKGYYTKVIVTEEPSVRWTNRDD